MGSLSTIPAMVEDFLELGGGFTALMGGQIGFSAHKDGIQWRSNRKHCRLSAQLIRRGGS